MAFSYPGVDRPESPPTLTSLYQWAFQAYVVINNLLDGGQNCTGTVTLTASSATTTLTDARLTALSHVTLMPLTANAANALTTVYFTGQDNGSLTINHASDFSTDRNFRYFIVG